MTRRPSTLPGDCLAELGAMPLSSAELASRLGVSQRAVQWALARLRREWGMRLTVDPETGRYAIVEGP